MHGPVRDGDDACGLALASLYQAEGAGVVSVVPGGPHLTAGVAGTTGPASFAATDLDGSPILVDRHV
jgi:hypothetical protein